MRAYIRACVRHEVYIAAGCTNDIMTSDHSPVFAVYKLFNMAPYINSGQPAAATGGTKDDSS